MFDFARHLDSAFYRCSVAFQFDVSTAEVWSIPELILVPTHGSIAIPRKVETEAAMNMAGNSPISDRTCTNSTRCAKLLLFLPCSLPLHTYWRLLGTRLHIPVRRVVWGWYGLLHLLHPSLLFAAGSVPVPGTSKQKVHPAGRAHWRSRETSRGLN